MRHRRLRLAAHRDRLITGETARAAEAAILFVPHVIRSSGFSPFAVSIAR
jgi:hypothetical protein